MQHHTLLLILQNLIIYHVHSVMQILSFRQQLKCQIHIDIFLQKI